MKNKYFVIIMCALFSTLMLFSPLKLILCETGAMTMTNIGNEFRPALREDASWYTPIYNAVEKAKSVSAPLPKTRLSKPCFPSVNGQC